MLAEHAEVSRKLDDLRRQSGSGVKAGPDWTSCSTVMRACYLADFVYPFVFVRPL